MIDRLIIKSKHYNILTILIMKVFPQMSEKQNSRCTRSLTTKINCYSNEIKSEDKIVNSTSEEQNHTDIPTELIDQRIYEFKHEKAKEIAYIHEKTKESIENIVSRMKNDIHQEVQSIINLQIIASSKEKTFKSSKEDRSTMPNTSKHKIQTPGFDLSSQKNSKNQLTVDPRQFTLGQKEQASSNRSLREPHENSSLVSQFLVAVRYPTSRRIKDRIMNSGKCRDR